MKQSASLCSVLQAACAHLEPTPTAFSILCMLLTVFSPCIRCRRYLHSPGSGLSSLATDLVQALNLMH